ncbi:hypothetical protein ACGYLO_17850 [Sulfitobacter sp. 1A13353]|uniref:hypothetical protein n=1 Tax=Sulfitobacter sp. 1A13353 TaxID=3368568 RepID=UPI0037462D3F
MIAPMRDAQRNSAGAAAVEESDFDEWLFWQSNVMLDLSLEHQKMRYRDDKAWHQRSHAQPYQSKA